jgi:peptidoglycan-associated lipoprotein
VGAQSSGADSASAGAGAEEGAAAPGPMSGTLARRIIYFDFDSSEIKGEGAGIVAAHARYLATNPTVRVRLEGHTDERGSREYNIGLGERRAQSVRRALLLQGATETQLSTVSYGAERPVAAGSNESAWQQNRRVEIVYLK